MRAVLKGRAGLTALVSVLACALFALAPVAASAAHAKIGQITEANSKPLTQPWGLAFDNSGNLFVGEPEGKVVDTFNSLNAFGCQIGAGEFPEPDTRNLTVNYAKELVYVAESGPEQVWVYKHEGGCTYKLVQKVQFEHFLEVAYDNSSGPNKGDLYVVGAPRKVWVAKTNSEGLLGEGKFKESEENPTLFETLPTLVSGPVAGGFELTGENGKGGIALDNANGDLFLTEPPHKQVAVYGPEGKFQKYIEGTNTKAKSFEPFGIGIEESTGHLYVYDHAHHVIDEIPSTEEKPASVSEITEGVDGEALAVAVSNGGANKHDIYVSDLTPTPVINIYEGTPVAKYLLKVEKEGTGSGTVTGEGINCGSGAECEAKVNEGEEVTLTETPATGSSFVHWGGACSGNATTCKVIMSAAQTVKAEFSLNPPSNTGQPAISGTAQAGHTLKTTNGTWTGSPSSFSYQWEDCNALGEACLPIGGATASEYTLTNLDVGDTIRVAVTAKNAGGSSSPATSAQTAVVVAGASNQINPVVEGTVPQTESLESTCTHVPLGEFLPGVPANYEGTCALRATDTSGESKVTAEDAETSNHEGHLVQGSYFLPKALEVKAADAQEVGAGGPFTQLTSPVTLLTYATPISAHELTVTFNQSIAKNDGLHTGRYAKTITITLSTTKA